MIVDSSIGYIQYSRSSRVCSLLSVESLLMFEDVGRSLLNLCLFDVFSLILTEPHTDQIKRSD